MHFYTAITHIVDGKEIIRGHELEELIKHASFVEVIGLLFFDRMPTEKETRMLNAIFVSAIDHGPGTASALVARISASAKNPIHASLAAGILGFGERHGMAASTAMIFFQEQIKKKQIELSYSVENEVVILKKQKVHIPGYGHKIFKEQDSRANALFQIAKEMSIFGEHCMLALEVRDILNKLSSKKLPLNIDGAIGAILADMGLNADMANAFFLVARVPGLIGQILEERKNDVGIRRLEEKDIAELE